MEGNLVIVESPAKAKTIQKYLGDGFTVKSSFGHIRDLQDSKLSVDVEHGFAPVYVVPEDKKKVVDDLTKAAGKAGTVWLASDEDREGEAISWHLMETLGLDKARVKRIAFHEITKEAILEAIKNPRDLDMNLVYAQQARRVLDRLVGFELSPILWRKVQRGLSAGRVQSVALRLVVDREREIMAFVPEPFYKVEASFLAGEDKIKATLDTKFNGLEEARNFLKDSIGATYCVESVEQKEGVRHPAPPFTTSTLQQEASRRLHFPVSLTMRLAQSLYERGLITYMRTDSTNLSSLALGTSKAFITEHFGAEYSHPRQYRTHTKGAQEAHEAIRPTFISDVTIEGTAQEKKLYSLIWKRTVASQMTEAKVLNTTVKIGLDKRSEKYQLQGAEVLFDGFLKAYSEFGGEDMDDEDNVTIPPLAEGQVLRVKSVNADCKFTTPPYRFSEATLVRKLEELGIGRPSTYAPTITTLTSGRGYLVKGDKEGRKIDVTNLSLHGKTISKTERKEVVGAEKGKLLPQEIGLIVTDYLVDNFNDIMDYDFTANVEKDFDKIADGELVWNNVIAGFYDSFHQKVDNVIHNGQFSHVTRELGVDPADGQMLVAKFGQYGPFVQKGDGDNKQYASLAKGQLIETLTLEDAIKLFEFPKTIGQLEGEDVIVTKGRFGPYIRYAGKNYSLPRNVNPGTVSLKECEDIIKAGEHQEAAAANNIAEFKDSDIVIVNGRYGPYIKHAGSNYKLPKGADAASLTEEDCKKIIAEGKPTAHKYRKFTKKTK
ncbi:MAG: type I DNA topoisomerase [Bacteroidales bacterium]|nr:type I DNA topoisomerase [Bacteroidales bacterium]